MCSCGGPCRVFVLQTLLYSPLWGWNFFGRNLALCGGLLLLMAEARSESKKDFAGIPSMGDEVGDNRFMVNLN